MRGSRKMNSLTSDDLTREYLALETAECLRNIFANTQKVNELQQEILEINLSISAYVEESWKHLEGLRLEEAKSAPSSHQVVQTLSDKCKNATMTSPTPISKKNHRMTKTVNENNNNKNKITERQQARSFISWYKQMIDHDRHNLALYLSDDVILEWFGRTVKNRKKVSGFLKNDMQCSRHDFTTVESIEKVELRSEEIKRKREAILVDPLNSPEIVKSERPNKRRLFQTCHSPEWAEGCKPIEESSDTKRSKTELQNGGEENQCHGRKRLFSEEEEIGNKGDGLLGRKSKRKCIQDSTITPPNIEVGQGDCLPSTSGTDSDRSHDTLNAQLPKLAVECNGYIEFMRSRNSRSTDSMKWDRKCKVQISYSEDPLNIGEYIIWMLRYTDDSKCRRNLLPAFEEAALEEAKFRNVQI